MFKKINLPIINAEESESIVFGSNATFERDAQKTEIQGSLV